MMRKCSHKTGTEKQGQTRQTCALGSAIAAAVVAGKKFGGYDSIADAQDAMCGVNNVTYKPIPENQKTYRELYKHYKQLLDALGTANYKESLYNVMEELLVIKEKANA